jgi:hypothetical protein
MFATMRNIVDDHESSRRMAVELEEAQSFGRLSHEATATETLLTAQGAALTELFAIMQDIIDQHEAHLRGIHTRDAEDAFARLALEEDALRTLMLTAEDGVTVCFQAMACVVYDHMDAARAAQASEEQQAFERMQLAAEAERCLLLEAEAGLAGLFAAMNAIVSDHEAVVRATIALDAGHCTERLMLDADAEGTLLLAAEEGLRGCFVAMNRIVGDHEDASRHGVALEELQAFEVLVLNAHAEQAMRVAGEEGVDSLFSVMRDIIDAHDVAGRSAIELEERQVFERMQLAAEAERCLLLNAEAGLAGLFAAMSGIISDHEAAARATIALDELYGTQTRRGLCCWRLRRACAAVSSR